jgi:DNA repair protein RadD
MSYNPEINAGIYSASKGRREVRKFTFATIGSIYKQPENFMHFKYVIIDECHGVNPKNLSGMLTSFLKAIGCEHVCGLTATPYRIDTKWTKNPWGLECTAALKMINRISRTPFFKKILYKIETQELIDEGYLSPVKYFVDKVELDDLVVNTTGADFTEKSIKDFWGKAHRLARIEAAVVHSHKVNQRTLVFCSLIAQAEKVSERLYMGYGIMAPVITGKTPMAERERIINQYRAGEIKHILNVGVFTTGFDVPELDCIVLARPTMSLALYYQMIGRGIRLDPARPEKELQVYDLVGVVERLGRVETIRVKTERGGFKDEVWSECGRMDNTELYSFLVPPKEKENGNK